MLRHHMRTKELVPPDELTAAHKALKRTAATL